MASEQQSDDVRNEESTAWLEGVHDLIAALQDTAVSEVEIRFGDTAVFSAPADRASFSSRLARDARAPSEEPARRTAIKAPSQRHFLRPVKPSS